MKRIGAAPLRRRRATALGALVVFLGSAATAWALPPFTTAPKIAPSGPGGQAQVSTISVGCHATYDRFVLRFRFATPGYSVRLVNRVTHDPSGRPVRLLGNGRLLVVIRDARAHTLAGTSTVPRVITPLCANLRQVKAAGDFEGVVSFGLGLRHRAGFRVFRLASPTRVVVDIAH
jgi:hypothetical protein